jgi:hypothetical protein
MVLLQSLLATGRRTGILKSVFRVRDCSGPTVRRADGSEGRVLERMPRPTVFAGPVIDASKPVSFERGDPLYYVRFRTENPGETFELKHVDFTQKLRDAVTARINLMTIFPKISWRLMHELGAAKWFDDS